MENKKYSAQKLALEMTHNIGSLGVLIEDFGHVRNVLSGVAADAREKRGGKFEPYFLYENIDTIQTVDNLMYRLLKEINGEYKQINEMQEQLRELMNTGEMDGTKRSQSLLKGVRRMSHEGEREVALIQNAKCFLDEFKRLPTSEQEVFDWVAGLVAELDPIEEKKPSPDCNQEKGIL